MERRLAHGDSFLQSSKPLGYKTSDWGLGIGDWRLGTLLFLGCALSVAMPQALRQAVVESQLRSVWAHLC